MSPKCTAGGALVLYCAVAPFADVPKHAGWIHDISDPKSPWLYGRRAWRRNIEFSREIEPINMRPPSVKIINHELHHKVFSPVLLIMALKYETAGTSPEDRHISIEKFFEAQRLVEVLREIKVFCRHEWAGEFCSARNLLHFFLLQIRTGLVLVTWSTMVQQGVTSRKGFLCKLDPAPENAGAASTPDRGLKSGWSFLRDPWRWRTQRCPCRGSVQISISRLLSPS